MSKKDKKKKNKPPQQFTEQGRKALSLPFQGVTNAYDEYLGFVERGQEARKRVAQLRKQAGLDYRNGCNDPETAENKALLAEAGL